MMLLVGSHWGYITLLPSLSVGRGWVLVDFMWWMAEFRLS